MQKCGCSFSGSINARVMEGAPNYLQIKHAWKPQQTQGGSAPAPGSSRRTCAVLRPMRLGAGSSRLLLQMTSVCSRAPGGS